MLWMTENFEWHDMTAGGILFVDHFWKKEKKNIQKGMTSHQRQMA